MAKKSTASMRRWFLGVGFLMIVLSFLLYGRWALERLTWDAVVFAVCSLMFVLTNAAGLLMLFVATDSCETCDQPGTADAVGQRRENPI
jgi:hypothetical protein